MRLSAKTLSGLLNRMYNKLLDQILPRKLSFIQKDQSNIEDYKRSPDLASYMKVNEQLLIQVTLEMVSQIFEIKVTLFYLNGQGLLTGLIVNERGYQE